jgi:hypothetical protein
VAVVAERTIPQEGPVALVAAGQKIHKLAVLERLVRVMLVGQAQLT